MPSPAANAFDLAAQRGRTLSALAANPNLRPLSRSDRRVYLHASLASYVAAWESYVERVAANFFTEIADPHASRFFALHTLLQSRMERSAKKFNTPNWENAREFLLAHTGYDPINDWTWPARNMSGPALRLRLNEILQVRHSFAHGAPMPSFVWNVSQAGEVRLTRRILSDVDAFFVNLVTRTDGGLKAHIRIIYGANLSW